MTTLDRRDLIGALGWAALGSGLSGCVTAPSGESATRSIGVTWNALTTRLAWSDEDRLYRMVNRAT